MSGSKLRRLTVGILLGLMPLLSSATMLSVAQDNEKKSDQKQDAKASEGITVTEAQPATVVRKNGTELKGQLRYLNSREVSIVVQSPRTQTLTFPSKEIRQVKTAKATYTYNGDKKIFEKEETPQPKNEGSKAKSRQAGTSQGGDPFQILLTESELKELPKELSDLASTVKDTDKANSTRASAHVELLKSLGRTLGSAAVPILKRYLEHPNQPLRTWAVSVLGDVGEAGVPVLLELLEREEEQDPSHALGALKTLSKMGRRAKSAGPGLLALARRDIPERHRYLSIAVAVDPDPDLRVLVGVLREFLEPGSATNTKGKEQRKPARYRNYQQEFTVAIDLVAKLGPAARDVMPELTGQLEYMVPARSVGAYRSSTRTYVQSIMAVLPSLGPAAASALPVLRQYLKDESGDIQKLAENTIETIKQMEGRPEGPGPIISRKATVSSFGSGTKRPIAIAPDGTCALLQESSDGSLSIWDTRNGQEMHSLEESSRMWHASFSVDSRYLVREGAITLVARNLR